MILKPQEYLDLTENKYAGYLRALDDFKDMEERGVSAPATRPNLNSDHSMMTYVLQEDEKAAYRLAKFMEKQYKLITTVSRVYETTTGVYDHLPVADYLFESLPWMDPGPKMKFGKDLDKYRVM